MSELESAVRKVQIRLVGRDKSVASKTMEVAGYSTDKIKFVGDVGAAYVNCCNEKKEFEKTRKIVELPSEVNCGGCDTKYGIKRENNNTIKIYGR